ncbi:hypothetical protein TSAR_013338 [Trichomalopsis sarcophagae]|uniref:Uncharacterized protein n=1 Tax=Trichomalopsis sarcophagae TaxID=543379 RepID=A0A232EIH2_9HYME|nr:hypothetical protein TSAR_013338 [Trichomalopsis sarcophagae]
MDKIPKKCNNINYIINNNKQITDANEMTEHMNNFFCDIGKQIQGKIHMPKNEKIKMPSMNNKKMVELMASIL